MAEVDLTKASEYNEARERKEIKGIGKIVIIMIGKKRSEGVCILPFAYILAILAFFVTLKHTNSVLILERLLLLLLFNDLPTNFHMPVS